MHSRHLAQVRNACEARDLVRVRQLFAQYSLDADDATEALRDAPVERSLYRFLLESGANANAIHILQVAWAGDAGEILKMLAEYQYDFKAESHRILQDFADDPTTLKFLLDQGADISRTDTQRFSDGFRLPIGAADHSLHVLDNVAANGDIALFDYLVNRGADPSHSLALHSASRCPDARKTKVMLNHLLDKHGMDINADTAALRNIPFDAPDSGTPLCSAVYNGNLAAVEELLRRGARLGASDKSHADPVITAIGLEPDENFLPALEPLLRAGADAGKALRYAVQSNNLEAAEICLKFGADPTLVEKIVTDEENNRAAESWMGQPGLSHCYSPVDLSSVEIRLLTLKPGVGDEEISCSLQHVFLIPGNDLMYETVSYCWGDPNPKVIISVSDSYMRVPFSTAQALRRFRLADRDRILWIDSICINQTDTRERNHQVKQMEDIFSRAACNLIWLGYDDGTVTIAVRDMQNLLEEIRQDTNNFETFPARVTDQELHASIGTKVSFDPAVLVRLCRRPWFGRLWVVQEATLAKSNLCHVGTHDFDLLDLLRVAVWVWSKRAHVSLWSELDGSYEFVRNTFAKMWIMASLVDQEFGWFSFASKQNWWQEDDGGSNAPLFSLLGNLQPFAATEPVDHVFGLLGLYERFSGTSSKPQTLLPDYSKTVAEVFSNATRVALTELGSLALYQHHHRRAEDPNALSLPSWVPRWHQGFDAGLDPTPFNRGFLSSNDWLADRFDHPPGDPLKIMLEGIFVDRKAGARICTVSEPMLDTRPSLELLRQIDEIAKSHSGELHLFDDNKDLNVHLTHVCTAGEDAERNQLSSKKYHGFEDFIKYHEMHGKPPPAWHEITLGRHETEAGSLEWRAARFSEACFRAFYRRRFFITEAGRLGIGPEIMEVGDFVTVLYGGQWPFILRPCDADEWEMIGTSYSPTVMNGSAVREHEERGDEDVMFTIR